MDKQKIAKTVATTIVKSGVRYAAKKTAATALTGVGAAPIVASFVPLAIGVGAACAVGKIISGLFDD